MLYYAKIKKKYKKVDVLKLKILCFLLKGFISLAKYRNKVLLRTFTAVRKNNHDTKKKKIF